MGPVRGKRMVEVVYRLLYLPVKDWHYATVNHINHSTLLLDMSMLGISAYYILYIVTY